VSAAVDEVKNREETRDDWNASREHRDALAEAYPNSPGLENYVMNKLGWHRAFQENPVAAREQYIRAWSKTSPFHPKVTAKVEEKAPEDWWESGKAEWQADKDARDGYRQAAANAADDEAFTTTAKLRQLVKERTGLSFSDFLSKARAIDQASLDDPAGIATRFALFSGMPSTQAEAQEMQAAMQRQARTQEADSFLRQREQSGELPQDYKSLEPEIAVVLEQMTQYGARSGDLRKDHDAAIQIARDRYAKGIATEQTGGLAGAESYLKRLQAEGRLPEDYAQLEDRVADILHRLRREGHPIHEPQNRDAAMDYAIRTARAQATAAKAKKASRSVSGAPAPGARSAATQRSRGGSYDDDLHADVAAAVRAGSI
jgi:hypothetical protein